MKPKGIVEIETKCKIELIQIIEDDRDFSQVEFYKNENTYSLNAEGEVIKLNLKNNYLESIASLKSLSSSLTHLNLAGNKLKSIEELSDFHNLIFLDLSTNLISNIDVIKNLKNLEFLYLDHNLIIEIPKFILPKLITLWLYNNKIVNINNLKSLVNLESISLAHNSIADISVLKEMKKLKQIYLNDNNIYDIDVLSNFKSLIYLDLARNKIVDIFCLKNIEISSDLMLGENKIFDLTPLYPSLRDNKINFVNAFDNPLVYPPFEVVGKGEGAMLNWFEKIYEKVNEKIVINKKSREERLDLGSLGITDLSLFKNLFKLNHLKELIISNEWAEFDQSTNEWKRVESDNNELNNNIINIPNEISNLINLEKIYVGGDWKSKKDKNYRKWRIKDISSLYSLKKLSFINISNNHLEDISGIIKLVNLQIVHLNNNNIINVPELKSLKNLREIYLSNNLIHDVDFLNNCFHLTTVDLHSNLIEDLLPLKELLKNSDIEIKVSSWEKFGISIRNNSRNINPPYEVLNLSKNDFFLYLKQIEYESKLNLVPYYNNEVKVILVGNSCSGKSTFLNYLKTKRFKKIDLSTHWLVTEELEKVKIENEELKLRFFDFGGQDYYHDTHKIFFSSDSIYLLLWDEKSNILGKINDPRNNSNEKIQVFPLEYWLDSIKIFAKKSLSESERQMEQLLDERDRRINSKVRNRKKGNWIKDIEESSDSISKVYDNRNVLVIQNKIDKGKDFLDQGKLMEEYSNIYDFVNISILNKKGTNQFYEHYTDILKRNLNYKRPLLTTWGIIKDNLKEVFDEVFIIDTINFKKRINNYLSKKLKESYGKSSSEIASILFKDDDEIILFANFLNEIGLIIFNSKNENIKNTIVVNQNKFLQIVSKVLNVAKENEGEIHKEYLLGFEFLNETIQILISHNIIFENTSKKQYIAPLFLSEKPNFLVDLLVDKTIPYRRFKFEGFIPKSIILKVFSKIANKEDMSDEDFYYWKNGLIFKNRNGNKVLLKFNIGLDCGFAFIDIFSLENSQNYSFVIDILKIVKEIITNDCNGFKELVTLDGLYFADYERLSFNYKNEISYIEVINLENKKTKQINTFKYNDFMDENLKKPTKRIFISYSKFDEDYRKEFVKHLVTLRDEGLIEDFNCEEIDLGDNSHNVIQKELSECDYMIALVSVDFLNTDYIRKFEVEKAKELGKKIIPIIIKPCDWENSIVKDFHASLRGTNISLDKELFLKDKFKETSEIERHAWWTKVIKELRSKIFSK